MSFENVITHRRSLFFIAKKDQPGALAKLKQLVRTTKKPERIVCDPSAVLVARDLAEALTAAGFVARVDAKTRDITGLRWGTAGLPSDASALRKVLNAIAAHVRDPSMIEMEQGKPELPTLQIKIAITRGKARKVYMTLPLIGDIEDAAEDAAERKRFAAAIEGYRWLIAVEPDTADPEDRYWTYYREAWRPFAEVLAHAARWDDLDGLCARCPFDPELLFKEAFWIVVEKDKAIAERLARRQLERQPGSERARAWLAENGKTEAKPATRTATRKR